MKIHLNLAQSYHDYHTGTGSTDHSPQQEQNSTIPMCHRGSCGALILYKTNKHNKSTRSNKACFSSFFPYDTKQFFLRAVTLEKQWCLGQFHHAGGGHRVGIIVVVVTSLVGPQGRPLGGGDRVGVIVVVVTSLVGGQPHPDGGRGVRVGPVVVRRRLVGPLWAADQCARQGDRLVLDGDNVLTKRLNSHGGGGTASGSSYASSPPPSEADCVRVWAVSG